MFMKNIVIDTNLLLDDPKIIFKLSNKYDKIIVPLTVLKELDKHKFNPNLSFSARSAIYEIVHFKSQFPDKIELVITDGMIDSNDDLIISAAQQTQADIATKDISMSVIAEAKGIDSELYSIVTNGFFKPYIDIDVNKCLDAFTYQPEYWDENYEDVVKVPEVDPDMPIPNIQDSD